jgi:hypothetical protein
LDDFLKAFGREVLDLVPAALDAEDLKECHDFID